MTPEFERVVEKQYNSGSLSYTTLIRLLHSQSTGDRRCRKTIPKHNASDLVAQLPRRDIVDPVKSDDCDINATAYSDRGVLRILREYVSGLISTELFVNRLADHEITIIPELEQLIRRHEADNSVTFKEFARVLLWMGVCNM